MRNPLLACSRFLLCRVQRAPPSGSLVGWIQFSSWSPRSAPSLVGTVVKEAGGEGLPLLSPGGCSYAEALPPSPACATSQQRWQLSVSAWQLSARHDVGLPHHWIVSDSAHLLWPWSRPGCAALHPGTLLVRPLLTPAVTKPQVPLPLWSSQLPRCFPTQTAGRGHGRSMFGNRSNEWMKPVKDRKICAWTEKTLFLWLSDYFC